MRIHIEDLEAIKEMNDEMEEGHIETEKHLQTTLGQSDEQSVEDPPHLADTSL